MTKRAKKTKVLTPRQARTEKAIIVLSRHNVAGRTWWANVGPDMLTLYQQRRGGPVTGSVLIPRAEWDALVDWYQMGQQWRTKEEASDLTWVGEVVGVEGDVAGGEAYYRVTLAGTTDARVIQIMVMNRDLARYPMLRRVRVTVNPQ